MSRPRHDDYVPEPKRLKTSHSRSLDVHRTSSSSRRSRRSSRSPPPLSPSNINDSPPTASTKRRSISPAHSVSSRSSSSNYNNHRYHDHRPRSSSYRPPPKNDSYHRRSTDSNRPPPPRRHYGDYNSNYNSSNHNNHRPYINKRDYYSYKSNDNSSYSSNYHQNASTSSSSSRPPPPPPPPKHARDLSPSSVTSSKSARSRHQRSPSPDQSQQRRSPPPSSSYHQYNHHPRGTNSRGGRFQPRFNRYQNSRAGYHNNNSHYTHRGGYHNYSNNYHNNNYGNSNYNSRGRGDFRGGPSPRGNSRGRFSPQKGAYSRSSPPPYHHQHHPPPNNQNNSTKNGYSDTFSNYSSSSRRPSLSSGHPPPHDDWKHDECVKDKNIDKSSPRPPSRSPASPSADTTSHPHQEHQQGGEKAGEPATTTTTSDMKVNDHADKNASMTLPREREPWSPVSPHRLLVPPMHSIPPPLPPHQIPPIPHIPLPPPGMPSLPPPPPPPPPEITLNGQSKSVLTESEPPALQEKKEKDEKDEEKQQPAQEEPSPPKEAYERISQVGEGTYGKVYKARVADTSGFVALKRIRMENEFDGFPVTALREVKLLQSLNHENIICLREMLFSKGYIYMVFDYMEHDLTGLLHHPNIEFTPAHIKSLTAQLLQGLHYMHEQGVLHRDLKGPNILIGKDGLLKIADFGLARFYAKTAKHDYTNRVFTVWYRPPELLFGATVYGPEVDMWSAGCIFLELFTRKPIFQGDDEINQLDVIFKITGTPSSDNWPAFEDLPWYELIKPKQVIPSRFKEYFEMKWAKSRATPATLQLAESFLSLNPSDRVSARQALDFPYFVAEDPPPEMPDLVMMGLQGEYHDLTTKPSKRKQHGQQQKQHPTNYHNHTSQRSHRSQSQSQSHSAAQQQHQ